jgi:hypothetical protein
MEPMSQRLVLAAACAVIGGGLSLLSAPAAEAQVVCGIGYAYNGVSCELATPLMPPVVPAWGPVSGAYYGTYYGAPRVAVYGGTTYHGGWGATGYRGPDGWSGISASNGAWGVRGPGGGAYVHTENHGNFYRR